MGLGKLSSALQLVIADFLECEEFGRLRVCSKQMWNSLEPLAEWRTPLYCIFNTYYRHKHRDPPPCFAFSEAARALLQQLSFDERNRPRLGVQQDVAVPSYDRESVDDKHRHSWTAVRVLRRLGQGASDEGAACSLAIVTFPWKLRFGVTLRQDSSDEEFSFDSSEYIIRRLAAIDLDDPLHVQQLTEVQRLARDIFDDNHSLLDKAMRYFPRDHSRNRVGGDV